jgi:hypothetical protein
VSENLNLRTSMISRCMYFIKSKYSAIKLIRDLFANDVKIRDGEIKCSLPSL